MIVYQATKNRFLADTFRSDIHDVIATAFLDRTGRRVGASELASWRESLVCMAKVLNDDQIPEDTGVAIEYVLPQSGKRIDFIVTGVGADSSDNVIIIELKQWSSARRTDKDAIVKTRLSQGEKEVSHPSYQAWSYAALLKGFNEAVYEGSLELQPCAYLHNYERDDVIEHEFYRPYVEKAPLFLKGEAERQKLRAFIKRFVKHGDSKGLLYKIENGRIRPSKMLADSLVGLLKGKQEFVLIDDQKVVYESALAVAKQASDEDKRVFIVEGGPGTGKSVVAINLLVALTKLGLVCRYVSKNAAPRSVYESKLTGVLRKTEISNLFSGSGAFVDAEPNAFDVLIVDEAHRLNEKSGLYRNLGENQIKEAIAASKCTILFIDEDQRVTLSDIGTKADIHQWAHSLGASVTESALASQFRCNGSDGYLAWLDNALQIRDTPNITLDASEFDFRIFDSPEEMRKVIAEKNNASNKARMVAGYCWPWNSKKDSTAMDVVIAEHRFAMQWNLSSDGSLWIVGPTSVEQIGCIHTCQGLEVDYIGVVVGNDLVVRDGQVVTQPAKRAGSDRSIRGFKKLLKNDPASARARLDQVIKNTYRTLMTRGMKGCYVYFTDPEAAAYFRSRVAKMRQMGAPSQPPTSEPFRRLRGSEIRRYENCVPLVDLKIAAGLFSEAQSFDVQDCDWVELPSHFRPERGMFVAQVIGESMNRRIPNGSWCLFKVNPTGSRHGRVVVAQHRNIHDPDLGGSFTVKVYRSEKESLPDESWRHTRVILSPDSDDDRFETIEIDGSAAPETRIVAEFLAILE